MPEIELRKAVQGDAAPIRACIQSAYAEALRDLPDLPDVSGGVEEEIAAHDVYVAARGQDVLGVVVFERVDDAIMVFNLAVSPWAQGQGLAKRLLKVAKDQAVHKGLTRMILKTHVKMTATRAMYRHMGWAETGADGNTVTLEQALG
ncbi:MULTISPECIES: GNAT family N-acetyltransferase [unclassified Ruegeria]|uniref:GNAT family N-acetyltransferase n=1 Tax=unclassified Ruegeria TaxID=2625375 RepID=UPI0014881E14|nr:MULTISPECIES: GNAT family N-acetyltransferase [unclassified Ruegeria]